MGIGGEILGKARQNARTRFDQHHASLARVDVPIFLGQILIREFRAIAPANSTPVGPPPDDHEGQQGSAGVRDRSRVRRVRRTQDSPADRSGIFQVLEARRVTGSHSS